MTAATSSDSAERVRQLRAITGALTVTPIGREAPRAGQSQLASSTAAIVDSAGEGSLVSLLPDTAHAATYTPNAPPSPSDLRGAALVASLNY
jgi:hypothetical protein